MVAYTIFDPNRGQVPLTRALLMQIMGGIDAIADVGISTTGATGVLTAAGIAAGQITRTGPTADFVDTTATAAAIQEAVNPAAAGGAVGEGGVLTVKNATAWQQTLAAGAGVTLPGAIVIPPFAASTYFWKIGGTVAAPTVVFTHQTTVPIRTYSGVSAPSALALNTVGAGTITSINRGVIARGGAQANAPFTDTTDTAANLIASSQALGVGVGSAVEWIYVNNTNATATVAGGAGVTVSGQTVVPPNSWVQYLVTRNATATMTFVAIEAGYFPKKGTVIANGATPVAAADTAVTADSSIVLTLKTVGGTPHGAFVSAVTAGTGFSINSLAGDTSTYNYEIRG